MFGLASIAGIGYLQAQKSREASLLFGIFSGSSDEKPAGDIKKTETFVWGNGEITDKSEYLGIYPAFTPTKLETLDGKPFPNFVKVFTAEGVQGGIDQNGDLYAWPNYRQPSMVNDSDNLTTAQREGSKKLASNVSKAVYCDQGLWLLFRNGDVGRVQVNMHRGIDGLPLKTYIADNIDRVTSVSKAVDLSAGERHLLALTDDGSVYCLGDDTLGQCGQGKQGRTVQGPYQESREEKFRKVTGRNLV